MSTVVTKLSTDQAFYFVMSSLFVFFIVTFLVLLYLKTLLTVYSQKVDKIIKWNQRFQRPLTFKYSWIQGVSIGVAEGAKMYVVQPNLRLFLPSRFHSSHFAFFFQTLFWKYTNQAFLVPLNSFNKTSRYGHPLRALGRDLMSQKRTNIVFYIQVCSD